MNELALFAGAGGGILGARLLGWRTVGAVEIDPYCREVLLRRQEEGHVPPFPIWDDIRTFDGRPWRGKVDLVTAGFPCQPFSTAAHGRRPAVNLWPEAARVVAECCPRYVFLENVIGAAQYLRVVRHDLRSLGYCVKPLAVVAAASVGAGHPRERVWLLAYANRNSQPFGAEHDEMARVSPVASGDWWSIDPGILGMADGVAYRVGRFKAIGNGQVPAVVKAAWELLNGDVDLRDYGDFQKGGE